MTELKKLIYRRFKTEAECAAALGWSRQRLNKYTHGKSEMNIKAAWELSRVLEAEADFDEVIRAVLATAKKGQGG